jgi:GntR family transcriptional regulator of arabinose operon
MNHVLQIVSFMSTAIYQPLLKELREKVSGGRTPVGSRVGTELEMARRHKISRVSVRTAVSRLVDEGLLERRPGCGVYVKKTATSLQVVEAILPSLTYMWRDIALSAQDEGAKLETLLRICNARHDLETDLRMIQHLPSSGARGAIIGSLHQPALREAVARLHLNDFPIVLVDEHLDGIAIPSVTFADAQAGRLAAEYLLQKGHRRIGFVGFTGTEALGQRRNGLRDTLNDAGVPLDRSCIGTLPASYLVSPTSEALQICLEPLLKQSERPSALVFHDSLLAAQAYRIIRSLGLRIPQDLSIVGIGSTSELVWLEPTLACVVLPAAEMGRVAMDLLLQRLDEPNAPAENRVLPVTWQEGDSVTEVKKP